MRVYFKDKNSDLRHLFLIDLLSVVINNKALLNADGGSKMKLESAPNEKFLV